MHVRFVGPLLSFVVLISLYSFSQTSRTLETNNNTAACGGSPLPTYCTQAFPATMNNGTHVPGSPTTAGWQNGRGGSGVITPLVDAGRANISKTRSPGTGLPVIGDVKSLTEVDDSN